MSLDQTSKSGSIGRQRVGGRDVEPVSVGRVEPERRHCSGSNTTLADRLIDRPADTGSERIKRTLAQQARHGAPRGIGELSFFVWVDDAASTCVSKTIKFVNFQKSPVFGICDEQKI